MTLSAGAVTLNQSTSPVACRVCQLTSGTQQYVMAGNGWVVAAAPSFSSRIAQAAAVLRNMLVRVKLLALKPKNVSFDEASSGMRWLAFALQGLHDEGEIQFGQKVLVYTALRGCWAHLLERLPNH